MKNNVQLKEFIFRMLFREFVVRWNVESEWLESKISHQLWILQKLFRIFRNEPH